MADFLNHLIQRSGISPTGKEDAPLLQPRLASLFETSASAEETPVSPSGGRMADSPVGVSLPPEQLPSSGQNNPEPVTTQTETSSALKPAEISFEKESDKTASNKAPNSTVVTPATSRKTPLKPAYLVQPRQARVAARSKQRGNPALADSSTPADTPAPQGSGENLQRGTVFSGSEQAEGRLNEPVGVKQPAVDSPATRQVIRPRVESAKPDPASATLQTTAASLSNEQTVAEEKVVQIRIGRIDVHAAQPPAPIQPTRTTAPQPKMTLEDYLRHRENQR
jgi:hypothetical protein